MDGNYIWSYTRLNVKTTITQYLFFGDLLFIISNIDITSYPDDNIPYIAADNIDDLIKLLEEASTALLQCFDNIW